QFLVVARQRDVPRGELLLQRTELSTRQRVTKSARAAVREKTHATVAQAEYLSGTASTVVVEQADHFAFAEMIASAIRAELRNLFEEVGKLIRAHPFETQRERVARSVMTDVRRVFTTFRPIQRNAERVQYFGRRAVRRNLHAERFADLAGLARRTLTATWASGCAFKNRINARAADGFVRYLIGRQVELQKAHRAFDVHADRAGIDVRWRRENATDRRAVASVRIRIEHEIGHARRTASVERLLKTRRIEASAN